MQRIFGVINGIILLCVILVAYNSIRLVTDAIKSPPAESTGAVAVCPVPMDAADRSGGIKVYSYYAYNILRRDLFSEATPPAGPVPHLNYQTASPLPALSAAGSVPLVLKGTIFGDVPGMNFAILKEADSGQERLCRIGDTIHNAEIVDIQRKKIILRSHGEDEELYVVGEEKLKQFF